MNLFNIFNSKSQIENVSLQRILPDIKKRKIDTVFVSTNRNCSLCSKYNQKIYSLYGWSKKYPNFPDFLYQRTCPQCKTFIGITLNPLADSKKDI